MGLILQLRPSDSKHIITKKKVFSTFKLEPKRICFSTIHKKALKKTGYSIGPSYALFLPFKNTIKNVFDSFTKLKIHPLKNGKYWCPANNEKELNTISNFITQYNTIVFLRDELEVSCAISEYLEDKIKRCTKIGALEKKAKSQDDNEAINELARLIVDFVNKTPYYKDANFICGIPSSRKLPEKIAKLVTKEIGKLVDISDSVSFQKEKDEVKNKKDIEERWRILEAAELYIRKDIKGKKIILLDDMYQTGITMQFIAMKLLEAGASNVYGLSLVKAASNSL